MVSGVSFKNPAEEKKNFRKTRSVSGGLAFLTFFLVITLIIFGGSVFYQSKVQAEAEQLASDIAHNDRRIADLVNGSPAEYVGKSRLISHMIHKGETSDELLTHFQRLMVKGVVFQSVEHSFDKDRGISEATVVADADNYDSLADQINEWKKNPIFSSLRVGDISRDDESGFIVFATSFIFSTPEKTMFSSIKSLSGGSVAPSVEDEAELEVGI